MDELDRLIKEFQSKALTVHGTSARESLANVRQLELLLTRIKELQMQKSSKSLHPGALPLSDESD